MKRKALMIHSEIGMSFKFNTQMLESELIVCVMNRARLRAKETIILNVGFSVPDNMFITLVEIVFRVSFVVLFRMPSFFH